MVTAKSGLPGGICESVGGSEAEVGLTADAREIAVLRDILDAEADLPIMSEECSGAINPFSAKLPVAEVDCSAKRYCKDMSICDEAKAYLIQCGFKNLDRDGDGVPCEALCN